MTGGSITMTADRRNGDPTVADLLNNVEAEQRIIGLALRDNRVWPVIAEIVDPHHFGDPLHAQIFKLIGETIAAGQAADPITLAPRVAGWPDVGEITVPAYLGRLVACALIPAQAAAEHARQVREIGMRRAAMAIGHELTESAAADIDRLQDVADVASEIIALRQNGRVATAAAIDAARLFAEPADDRTWLIDNMIPEGEVVLLGADGGSGKSLLALQLAFAAMTGRPFIGQEPTRRFRTIILSAEDDEREITRRLHRIAREDYPFSHDDLMRDAEGMTHIIDATQDVDPKLATFDRERGLQPTPMYRRLKRDIATHHADLVVIDSAADVFEEEIDRYAVRSFIRLLRGLGCTVLLLAHPSVDAMKTGRGYSGSTHWNNAVRARLYLRRDSEAEDPDARILEMAKSNYGPTGNKIRLTWQDGRFIPHVPSVDDVATQLETEQTFLSILAKYNDQGRSVSPAPRANNYAPRQMMSHPDAEGLSRHQLERAMEHLLSAGRLRVEPYGPPSKGHQRLVIV